MQEPGDRGVLLLPKAEITRNIAEGSYTVAVSFPDPQIEPDEHRFQETLNRSLQQMEELFWETWRRVHTTEDDDGTQR